MKSKCLQPLRYALCWPSFGWNHLGQVYGCCSLEMHASTGEVERERQAPGGSVLDQPLGGQSSGEILLVLQSNCSRVVSNFKTFCTPMQSNSDKLLKVCSMLGWLWEGQYFKGEYVTVIVPAADTSLLAVKSASHYHLFPFMQVQVTMYQVTHPQGLGSANIQIALECPTAAVNSLSWCSEGILISLLVKWNQWDKSACHWLLLDHTQVALRHGRMVALSMKHVYLLPSGKFWQLMFAVCTLFPIAEA